MTPGLYILPNDRNDAAVKNGGGDKTGTPAAAPAPFTDDLLMDKEQLKRFMSAPVVHSRDFNERQIGKDEPYTWRDAYWFWLGSVPSFAIGICLGMVGLVLIVLAATMDWSGT